MWWRWSDAWFFLKTFFPVRLLFLHLRRSFLLLAFFALFWAFISGNLASSYGLHYLFLRPEYLGERGFWSYFIVGITAGLFTMAFQVNSYIFYSYRFPFMAAMSRPLWKFSLNNSLLPLAFFGYYFYAILRSHSAGLGFSLSAWAAIAALLLGIALTIGFTFSYFMGTIRFRSEDSEGRARAYSLNTLLQLGRKRQSLSLGAHGVNYYLRSPWRLALTRQSSAQAQQQMLQSIEKHHFSAFMYFILLILLLILLGYFGGQKIFEIPAGASIFLIASLYLMIFGAIYARLKTWTLSLGLLLFLAFNYLASQPPFRALHPAYGMDYEGAPAPYQEAVLDALTSDSILAQDYREGLAVLEAWRQKFPADEAPYLGIVNLSGGGLRSTLFSLQALAALDSLSEGEFFPRLHLLCGSSGGMLGAAYYRDLSARWQKGQLSKPPWHQSFIEAAGQDLLNPVAFSLAVNDLFIRRLKWVEHQGRVYPFDRGYAFDQRWLENTDYRLDYPLDYYREAELQAQIPSLILSPTMVGDGRQLLISNRGLSYLCFQNSVETGRDEKLHDAVEFRRLFKEHGAGQLRMATALRMSASFPYITPLVRLPSQPPIELIDAGVRDNEGLVLALRYLRPYRQWLAENTAGVRIIQLKADRPEGVEIHPSPNTWLGEWLQPIAGVVRSFANLQDYNKALLSDWAGELFPFPIEIYRVNLLQKEAQLSLSWQLTHEEKIQIKESLARPDNQAVLRALSRNEKKPAASRGNKPAFQPTKQN